VLRAGLYARVPTHDPQTIPLQIRLMGEYETVGLDDHFAGIRIERSPSPRAHEAHGSRFPTELLP
jgi:hypothetical protein